jgi:transcriptional regulator with XRE-family HTH domain
MAAWSEQIRQCRYGRGLTQEEFARELAHVAWEQQRVQVGVDAAMVSKWERGTKQPSRRYQRLIAHLSGRPTLPIGPVAGEPEGLGLDYARTTAEALDAVERLGRADMERRSFLRNALFVVGASIAPSRDWLIETIDSATAPAGRVSDGQVQAIRRTFGIFQEMDVMRGGGHARHQLADYVTTVVTPLLRANDSSTATGRGLYEAGAEQLYLLGWMAYDDGDHGLAQRYLLQALRLAQEAHCPELGAHVLAGLSDQATLIGHPDQALQLARAGRAGLRDTRSHACLADLWALQARAEAANGDAAAAARSVLNSEREVDAIQHDDEPEWARFIDAAYLNGEYANAFRDLGRPSETQRFASVSANEASCQNRARRGSLAHATLARSALVTRDLEAAAAAASTTVRLAVAVKSRRSTDAVNDLRERMTEHKASPAVSEFFELADALVPQRAGGGG